MNYALYNAYKAWICTESDPQIIEVIIDDITKDRKEFTFRSTLKLINTAQRKRNLLIDVNNRKNAALQELYETRDYAIHKMSKMENQT